MNAKNAPMRFALLNKKGWTMPHGAVFVGAGTKWANPFAWHSEDVKRTFLMSHTKSGSEFELRELAVELFKDSLIHNVNTPNSLRIRNSLRKFELLGRNLICTCALDKPCHADVLLDLANRDGK